MRRTVEQLISQKGDWSEKDFIFFWGHHKTNGINKGCFSQWWPCTFEVDDVIYNCAEQYMMAQKAVLFNDHETLQKILLATEPKVCKGLGRQVRNFDSQIWDKECYDIVFKGNYAKFSQNEDLKKELMATEDRILVEASPYDRIWGIGMSIDHPNHTDPSKWKGTNLLGFALTDVKDVLRLKL